MSTFVFPGNQATAYDQPIVSKVTAKAHHGHDGDHRAVHRHRDGHLVEWDLVEEDLHVFDGIDGDA